MMSRLYYAIAVGVIAAGAAWGVSAQSIDPESVVKPDASPAVNLGEMSYRLYCAECHGVDGIGTDKGPPFLHKVYHPGHHGDQSFFVAALQGAKAHHWNFGDMKPVEGISEAQIESVVTYVRALQKANGIW